jgi:hypothetical protein
MELLLHSTMMRQHPPASLEELTQLLNQMQQQLQQQLLLQHALSQHMQPYPLTSLSASFPPTLALSAPSSTAPSLSDQRVLQSNQRYLTGSQLATNNDLLHNPVQVQPQSNPSNNAHLLSILSNLQNQSNVGTASGGPGGVLQPQNHLLDSSLINSSNNHLPLQQQPQHRQAAPR